MTHDAATLAAQRAVTEDTGPIAIWRHRTDNRFLTKMRDNKPIGEMWVMHSVVGIDGIEVALGDQKTAAAEALVKRPTVDLPPGVARAPVTYDGAVQAIAEFLVSRPELLAALAQGAPSDSSLADTPAPVDAAIPTSGQGGRSRRPWLT